MQTHFGRLSNGYEDEDLMTFWGHCTYRHGKREREEIKGRGKEGGWEKLRIAFYNYACSDCLPIWVDDRLPYNDDDSSPLPLHSSLI